MKLQRKFTPIKDMYRKSTRGLLSIGRLTSKTKDKFKKTPFRLIGALVMIIIIFGIVGGFNLAGINLFADQPSKSDSKQIIEKEFVVLRTVFVPTSGMKDITPSEFNVEVGKSYILEVDSKEEGIGNMKMIMIQGLFEKPLLLKKGMIQQLPFTAKEPGTYNITSAIGRVRGHIIAK